MKVKKSNSVILFLITLTTIFGIILNLNSQTQSNAPKINSTPNTSVLPTAAKSSEHIYGLKGISNVGRVAAGIYRGNQPTKEGYATLKNMGIKTVINLRNDYSEKNEVEAQGMKSIEIPLSVLKKIPGKTIKGIIAILTDASLQPIYLHCKLGQDRAGAIIAIYRMEIDNWNINEALEEMKDYNFNNLWHNLKITVTDYKKTEK